MKRLVRKLIYFVLQYLLIPVLVFFALVSLGAKLPWMFVVTAALTLITWKVCARIETVLNRDQMQRPRPAPAAGIAFQQSQQRHTPRGLSSAKKSHPRQATAAEYEEFCDPPSPHFDQFEQPQDHHGPFANEPFESDQHEDSAREELFDDESIGTRKRFAVCDDLDDASKRLRDEDDGRSLRGDWPYNHHDHDHHR